MQIVIDIPELALRSLEKAFTDGVEVSDLAINLILDAVTKGTPLPKGHGRIVDFDEISLSNADEFGVIEISVPTIIEADE